VHSYLLSLVTNRLGVILILYRAKPDRSKRPVRFDSTLWCLITKCHLL